MATKPTTKKTKPKKAAAAPSADKAKAAEERALASSLRTVGSKSNRFDTLTKQLVDARAALDDAIFDARAKGATYREISTATGRSTSWVQLALERKGYVPQSRKS